MNNVKLTVARNIAVLRQAKHMTQLELAEQLNYSDKAVSKWERGDATPDIVTLTEIANIFGVTLDYLVSAEHSQAEITKQQQPKVHYNHHIITGLAIMLVWLLALFAFVLVALITDNTSARAMIFLYALPVSLIVWLVFNSIWFHKKLNYLIVSLLMWSILMALHLSFLFFDHHIGLIYLLGIPGQAIILLWMFMKKPSDKNPAEAPDSSEKES